MLRQTGLTFEYIDDSTVDLKILSPDTEVRRADPVRAPKDIREERPAELEEVMVTAEKRAEVLQDVPLSIVAVSAAALQSFHIDSIADLSALVPNMTVSNVVGTESIYLRGVGGGGRNVGFDTRTGIYIDGVYVGSAPATNAMLLDVDRVEVLRGPQGFLFGQSSDSGAINIITNPPDNSYQTKASVSYGNDRLVDVAASANVPLNDQLFLKVGASSDHTQGFTRNVLTGAYVDGLDDQAGRVQIREALNDALTLDLSADFAQRRNHDVVGEARTNAFGTGPSELEPFQVDNNTPELNIFRNYGAAATVTSHAHTLDLVSITAYRRSYRLWIDDLDHSPLNIASIDYADDYSMLSEEMRVASTFKSRWRYTAGVYLTDGRQSSDRTVDFFSQAALADVMPGSMIASMPIVSTQSYAAFGSLDYDVSESLTFDVGMRLNYDKKELNQRQFGDPGVLRLSPYVDSQASRSDALFTPTLGLSYNATPMVLLYLKYSRGAKAGGFNADFVNVGAPSVQAFKAETANSYETGFKAEWLSRRLRTNLALFLTDYYHYQLYEVYTVSDGFVQGALQNAGAVRTYGAEFEIDAEPFPQLIWQFSGAWLSAQYQAFRNGGGIGVDYSGHTTEFSPKWTLTNVVEYSEPIPGTAEATAFVKILSSYKASEYTTPANQAPFEIAGYTVTNAQLGISRGPLKVDLFSNNLFNRRYDTSSTSDAFGTILGFRGTPRTYGIQFSYMMK